MNLIRESREEKLRDREEEKINKNVGKWGERIKHSLSLRSLHAFGGGYVGEASERGCGVGVVEEAAESWRWGLLTT